MPTAASNPIETLLRTIAESLLDRPLLPADGIPGSECVAAEAALQGAVPVALRVFYELVGNLPGFMSAFQRFAGPDELYLEDGYLVFAEENQGVCYWGVSVDDPAARVYQRANGDGSAWHAESLELPDFLALLLYYQMAQGGYEHAASLSTTGASYQRHKQELFAWLATDWRLVVNHAGLIIYSNGPRLIWYFGDPQEPSKDALVFASVLREQDLDPLIERFDFQDL
jgi:hypothetical protein